MLREKEQSFKACSQKGTERGKMSYVEVLIKN